KEEKKQLPPPAYLGPNEQFTWLVKEVVKPAKAEGKQRGGCAGVHFPQVEPWLLHLHPGGMTRSKGRASVYTFSHLENMCSRFDNQRPLAPQTPTNQTSTPLLFSP
ncbi:hypothetical protein XENORESO_012140, partial [Xenotaenia resolanae]